MPVKSSLPKRPGMVGWFDPGQLLATGIRAILADLFGSYADRREMQAALGKQVLHTFSPGPGNQKRWTTTRVRKQRAPGDVREVPSPQAQPNESLWIDFASDVGEGWDATYAVASCLGKAQLGPDDFSDPLPPGLAELPRADVLLLGGDLVYPTASAEQYEQRFVAPYHDAFDGPRPSPLLREDAPEANELPRLFAIPGNHDWYDGLGAFLKQICQQRSIGGWFTMQQRSYFAIQLPGGWWVWGIDIQLHADIDGPQQKYFHNICANHAKKGDKIILLTAEPVWVYNGYRREPDGSALKSNKTFEYFCDQFVFQNGLLLPLVLTGDLHHYASYQELQNDKATATHNWKITAGGGGAFLHPTHQLQPLLADDQPPLRQSATYPAPATSRRLVLLNLLFPFLNAWFCAMMGGLYLCFAWSLTAVVWYPDGARPSEGKNVLMHLGEVESLNSLHGWWLTLLILLKDVFFTSPMGLLVPFLLIWGCWAFADTHTKHRRISQLTGLLHGLIQALVMVLVIRCYAVYLFADPLNMWRNCLLYLGLFGAGFFIGGFLMGLYLLFSLHVLNTHETEAFSSLRIRHYKNFLRMHLTHDKLTIYPIAIPTVPSSWVPANLQVPDNPQTSCWQPAKGQKINLKLIEDPIEIPF